MNPFYKKVAFLLLFLLSVQITFSQISGKVVDQENNLPLEYASVTLHNKINNQLVLGVVTNQNGLFSFEKVKKGIYTITVSFLGYKPQVIEAIDYQNTAIDIETIGLTISNSLNEVVVKAEKASVISKIDKQIFDAKQFQNSVGGTGTDIVKNLPAVSINANNEITVRGSNGFIVMLNGKPTQGNPLTILNQLPANAIEKIELITAPSAKYDPEGKAGIINVFTKKGVLNGTFAQVNTRIGFPSIEDYNNAENTQRYGVDATYNYRKDKWNFSLGASYQRNDISGRREGDVFTIIGDKKTSFPSDGERSFDETNYSGRFSIDFIPNENNDFSVGFFAGKRSKDRTADILYFDNHAVSPANSNNRLYTLQYFNENLRIRRSDFALGSFDYAHKFEDSSKLSTTLLYEYTLLGGPTTNRNLGFPDTTVLIQDEFNTNDNPLYGTLFRIDYEFASFDFGKLEMGYQYRFLDHQGDFVYERRTNENEDFELVPEFSSEIDLKRTLNSGYVNLNGKQNKWEYIAGVRLEQMDRELALQSKEENTEKEILSYDYIKLFPSATIQYNLKDNASVKLAYSKRVQRTTTFKMNPFAEREHSETLEQGDKNLLPEFIDLVELGYSKRFKKGNSAFVTAYTRHTENLVNRVNTVFNDTILNRIYSNVGKARTIGLEVGANLKPTEKWTNFIGFNFFNYDIDGVFKYEENGETINQKIASNANQYAVNINSTYAFSKTSLLQFTLNYLSDRNTAQGEDSRFYQPNLTFRKTFLDNQLVATLQWQNMDLGLLNSNEQRITTARPNEFFTTTNYVYEVDMITLNLSYNFTANKNKAKFIKSEFGAKEF
jgi:outer membrane receptor protein involved in Fe transport